MREWKRERVEKKKKKERGGEDPERALASFPVGCPGKGLHNSHLCPDFLKIMAG